MTYTPYRCSDYFRFIPEAPNHSGIYAIKITDASQRNCTRDIHDALQFETFDACLAWCSDNPSPSFVPREHGFTDRKP